MTDSHQPSPPALPNLQSDLAFVPPLAQPGNLEGKCLVIATDGSARLASDHGAYRWRERPICPVLTGTVIYRESVDSPDPVANALKAREWAKGTSRASCRCGDVFVRRELLLPRGPQWDQAVTTALLGNWLDPLLTGGRLDTSIIGQIKTEAQVVHRQLVPLWHRRVHGTRVALLETPIGENLTLLDLLAGDLRMDDLVFEPTFDDKRINAILTSLTAAERRVAMAWAHPAIATWTEAARYAGEATPEAFGERVRRKLKRLGTRYVAHTQAATTTRGGIRNADLGVPSPDQTVGQQTSSQQGAS